MTTTNLLFENRITSKEELRSLIGEPSKRAENKVIHKLDQHCESIIKHSPFLVLSTSNLDGSCDASPRGDASGFVHIVDEKHIIIPERPGNKRLDSIQNILSNPHVGLLFLIPGMEETLRINGRAFLIRDQRWLEKMTAHHKKPELGIVVEVEEAFIHCAKAFIRSNIWKPSTWPERSSLPSMAEMLKDHAQLGDMTIETIEESLKESYSKKLY
jgi:PPOX class probable FMN-dependent enzyme